MTFGLKLSRSQNKQLVFFIEVLTQNARFHVESNVTKHMFGWTITAKMLDDLEVIMYFRVSVQGVKSLGGHFACLCQGVDFYEVKKNFFLLLFFKKKMEILLHF